MSAPIARMYVCLYLSHSVIMERPYWTNEQIITEMEKLDLQNVLDFADSSLLTNLSVTCLAHGHVDSTTVSEQCSLPE